MLAALLVATYYAGLPFEVGALTFCAAVVAAIVLDHRRGVTIPTSPAQTVIYRIGMAFIVALLGIPLLLILFDVKPASGSEARLVTVTGTIQAGSLDSSVNLPADASIGFATDSIEAKRIFSSCKHGDLCKVTGTVTGSGLDAFFSQVTKATLVRRSPALP